MTGMFRSILALTLFALAACAASPAASPQALQANADAKQAYAGLQVQQVEQHMLAADNVLTYGYAVVACGLRSPQWFALVHDIYAQDYDAELQQVPLNAAQNALAIGYADAHVQNPSPPPYICGRLQRDDTLAALDDLVGLQALQVVSAR